MLSIELGEHIYNQIIHLAFTHALYGGKAVGNTSFAQVGVQLPSIFSFSCNDIMYCMGSNTNRTRDVVFII